MAESLVSTVLNQLATITLQEVKLVRGVDAEIGKLTSNLQAIQAVLEDAEKRQVKEAVVNHWLEKLKDVSYDIDDVLDEWNTAILKQDAEKVCSFRTLSSGSCFGLRHDIALKIKNLTETLADIANEKNAYNFIPGRGSQEPKLLTTSVIDVSEVFGREQDANNIGSMLLSGNVGGPTPLIISIVGMGGLGKTTLARLVFNDPLVVNHFDKRIWVCVSDLFDDKRIAKEILESLKGEKTDLDGMDTILGKIRESIVRKKILLVLDDVWAEESSRWEPLKGSLKCGSPESRILLTTRKEKVATVMGSRRTDMVPVGLLSEEGCWKLFTHLAFSERSDRECKNLEDVGRRIVNKCKGLPLAVKVVGSLLRFKETKEQWQSVLDSEMWEIKEVEEGVFLPLLVSYYDLPSILRRCFLFCAVFPEDYVINKDELIKLWMAQGFFHKNQHKEMEMVGEECFKELAIRSFFQDFEKKKNDEIVSCKLHDMVHSFARFLTKNECFLVTVDNLKETIKANLPSKTIRHSFLMMGRSAKFPILRNNWGKVRTLLVCSNERNSRSNILNSIDKLKCLRILQFNGGLRKNIRKLIHLRYLNLSNNYSLKTLSEAVYDLYNLQILDISNCPNLHELPRGIEKLKNLRYLENRHTGGVGFFISKGMKRLTGLRTLRKFTVFTEKSAFKIEDLGNLGNLQGGLAIHELQKAKASKVRAARLSTVIGLRELSLFFNWIDGRAACNEAVVLEALEPPPLLESLKIVYCHGPTLFPSWMTSLTMLKTLELYRCYNWENLPPLGKLLSLEYLTIEGLRMVKKVGEELLGLEREEEGQTSSSSIIAFPSLKELTFTSMFMLEDWEYGKLFRSTSRGGGITIMPLLRSLTIRYCPKLKALPHHLFPQLQELEIFDCPILSRRFEEQRGEDWRYISHIPKRHIQKAQ